MPLNIDQPTHTYASHRLRYDSTLPNTENAGIYVPVISFKSPLASVNSIYSFTPKNLNPSPFATAKRLPLRQLNSNNLHDSYIPPAVDLDLFDDIHSVDEKVSPIIHTIQDYIDPDWDPEDKQKLLPDRITRDSPPNRIHIKVGCITVVLLGCVFPPLLLLFGFSSMFESVFIPEFDKIEPSEQYRRAWKSANNDLRLWKWIARGVLSIWVILCILAIALGFSL